MNTDFDTLYKQLNTAQKKAVDAIEGPVMVIAGPGTGKTTILTLRIANILKQTDTSPDSILALTFTESGAYNMRRKLVEIIGPAGYKVHTNTFHSFASKIIEQYPDYFPRIIGSRVLTEPEKIKIIEKILQSERISLLRPYGDQSYYVGPVLREIQILKRENISPAAFSKSLTDNPSFSSANDEGIDNVKEFNISDNLTLSAENMLSPVASSVTSASTVEVATNGDAKPKPFRRAEPAFAEPTAGKEVEGFIKAPKLSRDENKSKLEEERLKKQLEKNLELAFVYEQYELALAELKYYDFEDMLLELIHAMENDQTFKLMLQETYQYILADEHQDANAAQNKILELLSDFHDTPNLFIVGDDKQAIYRFQGATLENFLFFSKKYPGALIVDLEHNYRSHQGILDAAHSLILNNPTIPGRERTKLLSLQMGSSPIFITGCSSIHEELELVARFIKRMQEKGVKSEDIAILYRDNKHAEPISRVLKAHSIEHRIESDYNILNEPDVIKLLYLCKAINDLSDSEALAKALFVREMNCDVANVSDICNKMGREKISLHTLVGEYNDTKQAYDQLVEWSHDSRVISCPDFLQRLIQETDIVADIVKSGNSLERLNSIQLFFDHVSSLAKSYKTFFLKDFVDYLSIAEGHGINSKRKYTEELGGVRLMTAHRSKGLEFGHVFIIHAADGIWGSRSSRNLFTIPVIEHARNIGRVEDERRLFYVAMTRARDTVHVTYSTSDGDKDLLQSQFISEIDPALIDFDELGEDAKPILTYPIFDKLKKADKKEYTILDPNFVKKKFLSQPLSVTHLNNYLECPWQYFFVNLIRLPQAQSKHQMYGTAIHSVLRTFFNAFKEGEVLDIKKVMLLLKHQLDNQPFSKNDREESYKKGKKALEGYFDEHEGTWNPKLITEYAIKGVVLPFEVSSSSILGMVNEAEAAKEKCEIELTGKLDIIEFIDDINVGVVDYKTSKPKSRNEIEGKLKNADGNYKRQLVFYKLLLDYRGGEDTFIGSISSIVPGIKAKKSNMNMVYGEIDFVEPNERGKYKKERFEITANEVETLKAIIAGMAKEVASLKFIDKGCAKKDCEYCRLGKLLTER